MKKNFTKIQAFILCALFLVSAIPLSYANESTEWTCPSCEKKVTGNFCINCGAAKPTPVPEYWDCPSCGNTVKGNFCNNCGAKSPYLTSEIESTIPPTEAPQTVTTANPVDTMTKLPNEDVVTEGKYTFMPDRWNLYVASLLPNDSVSIERWKRWNAGTDDFEFDYVVSTVSINDSSCGFSWIDESHSAFFIDLKDTNNNKFDQTRVGFSLAPSTATSTASYTFTNDRWAQYRAYLLSPSTIKIECWGRWNAGTDDFEHYYDIAVIDTNDSSNGFSWIDDSHLAFFFQMEDEENSNWNRKLAKIGFSVAPNAESARMYSFTNDRWAQYRAYLLSPSTIKIECWGRWNAGTDDFEHYYDIGVIDTGDSSDGFMWADDSLSAFYFVMEDEQNSNWKRKLESVGFVVDTSSLSNAAEYTYLYDNWNLYKAIAVSPNTLKIECWGRWNAGTDDFEHYYDISTVRVDDPLNDFSWADDAFSAFSVSIIDYNNDDLDRLTNVSFTLNKEKNSAPSMATTVPKATATVPVVTETPSPQSISGSIEIPESQKDIQPNWNSNDFRYSINSDGTATITKYRGSAKTLIIEENIDGHPIVEIGKRAFSHNSSLESVIIPAGVKYIGEHAFSFADDLEEITITGPVEKIDNNAFYNCSRLERVTIGCGNLSIGERSFSHCSKLKTVSLIGNIAELNEHVFSYCDKLETISPLIGVTEVGDYAFYNCTTLKEIWISGYNLEVGERALSHCSAIKDIVISGSLSRIDTHAFSYCSKLENLTLATGLTKIGNNALASCGHLKAINYCGTEDEWKAVNIGSNNRSVDKVEIVYEYNLPALDNMK